MTATRPLLGTLSLLAALAACDRGIAVVEPTAVLYGRVVGSDHATTAPGD